MEYLVVQCIHDNLSNSQNTVRNFIKIDGNLPEKENAEIEQGQRVKSRHPAKHNSCQAQ